MIKPHIKPLVTKPRKDTTFNPEDTYHYTSQFLLLYSMVIVTSPTDLENVTFNSYYCIRYKSRATAGIWCCNLSILIIVFRGGLVRSAGRCQAFNSYYCILRPSALANSASNSASFQFLLLYSRNIRARATRQPLLPFNSYYCIRSCIKSATRISV